MRDPRVDLLGTVRGDAAVWEEQRGPCLCFGMGAHSLSSAAFLCWEFGAWAAAVGGHGWALVAQGGHWWPKVGAGGPAPDPGLAVLSCDCSQTLSTPCSKLS